jgi:hypothetical protein
MAYQPDKLDRICFWFLGRLTSPHDLEIFSATAFQEPERTAYRSYKPTFSVHPAKLDVISNGMLHETYCLHGECCLKCAGGALGWETELLVKLLLP